MEFPTLLQVTYLDKLYSTRQGKIPTNVISIQLMSLRQSRRVCRTYVCLCKIIWCDPLLSVVLLVSLRD